MVTAVRESGFRTSGDRSLIPGAVMMLAAIVIGILGLLLSSDLTENFPYLYLLPWITALFVVFLLPTAYLYYRGRLTLYDPLVFGTWSYLFPAFVVGGFMLTSGWTQPYFLSFIQDAQYNLPYTVVLIMLGYAGLTLGYFSPIGYRAGAMLSRKLPQYDFDSSAMMIPSIVLLVLGVFNSILALLIGVIGYQKVDAIEAYDGIVFLTTFFWMQGFFLIWYLIFKRGVIDLRSVLLVGGILILSVGRALYSGNRAGLLQIFIIVILAFLLSGRRLNFKRTMIAGTLLSLSLLVGMVYGSTFRNIKGNESAVSMNRYTDNIFETLDAVGKVDLGSSLEFALMGLAERLDTLSSVAVVVSNYEQLQPYEESYGLDNNIWKDISTFFIPRLIWADKPIASEPRKYSDLYFNYGENSFAITPFGDLVRNFGPWGVPIGMFLFGIVLRFIYRSLIEDQPRTIWRITMFFMLLMAVSYEGFYGTLVPFLFKVGFTTIVGLLLLAVVARALGHKRVALPD